VVGALAPSAAAALATAGLGSVRGASESNLQLTSPLVWVMVAISAAGAIVTFAFLVYAVVKFRDPKTRGRRYG
jgi:heme/copper-type cytochrome/quinol oxidase subunit 2